jgi:RNA polymerase sigma factor (sigma-70 family)
MFTNNNRITNRSQSKSRSKYLYLLYVIKALAIQSPSSTHAFSVVSTTLSSPTSLRVTTTPTTAGTLMNRGVTRRIGFNTYTHTADGNNNNNYNNNNIYNKNSIIGSHFPLHMSAVVDEVEEIEREQVKRIKKKIKRTKIVPAIQIQQPIRNNNNRNTGSLTAVSATATVGSTTTRARRATNTHKIVEHLAKQQDQPEEQSQSQPQPQHKRITMKKRKRKSSSSSSSTIRVSNLLTREEEITLTSAIRDLKSVIRIRDDLSASKTMNSPGGGGKAHSYLPNPMYKHQDYQAGAATAATSFQIQPSEHEWAQACNLSIVQLRRIMVKGRDARKRLVDGNVGLVTQIAKKYSHALQKSLGGFDNIGCILTLGDLVQEGNLGLMEAAERFESDKGFRFATYAVHWVRSRILRCIADNSRVIRLPAHVHTTLRTIWKTKSSMEKEFGREPSMQELANRVQIPLSKLQLYTDSSLPVLSLEVPLNNGRSSSKSGSGDVDKRTLMDRIASDSPTPQEDAEFESLRGDIRTAIDSLGNDLERDVLLNRFGLEDGNPRTLEETAHKLGISRDRVRRAEAKALNKLRHPQRNYMLKEYVENNNACDANGVGGGGGDMFNNYGFNNDEDKREDMMNDHFNNNGNGNRVTHFGDDTLNQVTPEMIWSF